MSKERRKFERLQLPKSAKVHVEDESGKRVGRVKDLGRGGLLLEPEKRLFTPGTTYVLFLVDPSEGIHRGLRCTVRNHGPAGVGFEFESLEPDAAVEVGILIGKYYAAGSPV